MKQICIFILFLITCSHAGFGQELSKRDYLESPFQFTFMIPPLSTNGFKNSITVNKISLNLFIGNSGGVDGFEAGGFINSDNYFVKGFQAAGFGNVVGGSVSGVQLAGSFNVNGGPTGPLQGAGLLNIVGKEMTGGQLAGFMNVAGTGLAGVQLAGFANINGRQASGLQGAGFINITGSYMNGAQLAGFINFSGRQTRGLQGAGFINVAVNYNAGAQLAGFANVAGSFSSGLQAAGFMNIAPLGSINSQLGGFFNVGRNITGVQIAGFANFAGKVKGIQIAGFLNVCDSIDGIPIAFINVVRKNGYRRLEFSISESSYATLSYKMGIRHFYNIYNISKLPESGNRWMLGSGVGYETGLGENMLLNVEVTANQEFWIADNRAGRFIHKDRLNMMNQAKTNFGFIMSDKVCFFVGPTFNVAVANTNPDLGIFNWHEIGPDWEVYDHARENFDRTVVKIWFGINGGVRF